MNDNLNKNWQEYTESDCLLEVAVNVFKNLYNA